MSLSNRELWCFMLGADAVKGGGDEGTLQIIVKYWAICRELGITGLSAEEMAALRKETLTTFGKAAQSMSDKRMLNK